MVVALLAQFDRDPAPVLRRTVIASLARALDALCQLGACDVADALLVLALRIRTTKDFAALADASMEPNLKHALAQYAAFLEQSDVYSFACLAFEMLTGRVLFEAPNVVAQIAMHLEHDGAPPALAMRYAVTLASAPAPPRGGPRRRHVSAALGCPDGKVVRMSKHLGAGMQCGRATRFAVCEPETVEKMLRDPHHFCATRVETPTRDGRCRDRRDSSTLWA
jgi:hypothetical protein